MESTAASMATGITHFNYFQYQYELIKIKQRERNGARGKRRSENLWQLKSLEILKIIMTCQSKSVLEKAYLENMKKSYTNPFRLIFISCILIKDDQLECIHAVCLETKLFNSM